MAIWTFYPAFIATLVSVVGLGRLAWREHDKQQPHNLSELAATQERLLLHFRNILWLCGTLFAITVYGFIVPRIGHPVLVAIAWSITYFGDVSLAIIPARDKTIALHNVLAQSMGVGMVAMAYLYWLNLRGSYAAIELCVSLLMTLLGIMAFADKRRFIFYELPFLYLSHISIVVAALALAR